MSPVRAILAGCLALFLGSLAALAVGVSPFATLGTIFRGALGSPYALGVTANAAAPLILLGLSFAFGLRGHVVNVGLQGQFLLGAVGSIVIATRFNAPPIVLVLVSLIAGALGGALWALLPALMKIWRGTNEIVTTLLMNFVGVYFTAYLLRGPIQNPGSSLAESAVIPDSARLPLILPGSRMSGAILVAILIALVIGWLLKHTIWGFKVRSVGMNPNAARYAGFRVQALTLQVFLISGALSGIAGALVILGTRYRLQEGIIDTWYVGIVVGLIGGASTAALLITGILLGALNTGGFEAQLTLGVPASIVDLIQGVVIVIFLLMSRLPNMRLALRNIRERKSPDNGRRGTEPTKLSGDGAPISAAESGSRDDN